MADRRKDANFSQGWGYAGFITALAIGAFVLAGTIKSRTYGHPRDPLTPSTARGEAHGPAADSGDGSHPTNLPPGAGDKH